MSYYGRDDFYDNTSSNQTNYYQEERRRDRNLNSTNNNNQFDNNSNSSYPPLNDSQQSQFQLSQPYRNDYYDRSTDGLASDDALQNNSTRGAVRENYSSAYDENEGKDYNNESYEKNYPSGRLDGGLSSSKSSSSVKKWIIITAILLVLIGAGVGAGLAIKSKSNSSTSSSNSSSSAGNTTSKGTSLQVRRLNF